MAAKKLLVAFDFDHTIIDDNSDTYIRKLAPDGKIPEEISELYSKNGWTEYMAAIFAYLHQSGTKPSQIEDCMKEIKFVEGMHELLKFLSASSTMDVIIISDSNSEFINCILKNAGLDKAVDKIYTNPAQFDKDGCLKIEYYHTQDWCTLSTKNLCKGHILDSYISEKANIGVKYDLLAYVGDGSNDLCPSLRLRSQDFIFPRKGYRLLKLINNETDECRLKGKVVPWSTGLDILETLKAEIDLKSS